MKITRTVIGFFALLFLFACAKTPSSPELILSVPAAHHLTGQQNFWWHAEIKVHWPENREPDFAIETMLANEVFGPILANREVVPELWRFHRRALLDTAGQNFSLIFYAPTDGARLMFDRISGNLLLKSLITQGVVDEVRYDSPASPTLPHVEDTSDKAWPETLQRAWPYFIMGASATWLDLVRQQASATGIDRQDTASIISSYRKVSASVDKIWHDYAQHAFFHHLDALFGYAPFQLKTELSF